MVDASDAVLEQSEEALDRVCMDLAIDVDPGAVPDPPMTLEMAVDPDIGEYSSVKIIDSGGTYSRIMPWSVCFLRSSTTQARTRPPRSAIPKIEALT